MYNKYLKEANHKLTEYIKIANTLEAEKERLSLLEQIQKDLIHRIENAIILIQNIQIKLAKNPKEYQHTYQNEILQVTDTLRKVYKDVRITITQIRRSGKVIK
jgi:ABC-type Zn uptake system ZnuABC Zn-binding protein ZnuA